MLQGFTARAVLALGLIAGVGLSTVQAQNEEEGRRNRRGPEGRGGFRGRGDIGGGMRADLLRLLEDANVQTALKINKDELAYIKLLADDFKERDDKFRASMADIPMTDRMAKIQEWAAKRNKDQEKEIGEIVGAERLTRLRQIRYQVVGVGILMFDTEAAKILNITEDQKQKAQTAMREMFASSFRRGGQEQSEEDRAKAREGFQKQAEEKFLGILTDAQRAKWKEMQGEPIDFKVELRGGPGGRRDGDRPRRERSKDGNRPAA